PWALPELVRWDDAGEPLQDPGERPGHPHQRDPALARRVVAAEAGSHLQGPADPGRVCHLQPLAAHGLRRAEDAPEEGEVRPWLDVRPGGLHRARGEADPAAELEPVLHPIQARPRREAVATRPTYRRPR